MTTHAYTPDRTDSVSAVAQHSPADATEKVILSSTPAAARECSSTVDRRAQVAYASWLAQERQHLVHEMYPGAGYRATSFVLGLNAGFNFHNSRAALASSRAVAVLAAVGCDWTDDRPFDEPKFSDALPPSPHFPHPDARLLDLEQDYLREHKAAEMIYARYEVARDEFERREAEHVEAERDLVMYETVGKRTHTVHWNAERVRRVLLGGFYGGPNSDLEIAAKTPLSVMREMLPRLEAREARRDALDAELMVDATHEAWEIAIDLPSDIAAAIYKGAVHTLDGLMVKLRVLRLDQPDLWRRQAGHGPRTAESYEVALTDIAEGVEHLHGIRGFPGGSAVHDVGGPAGIFNELNWITGGREHDDGTVCFTDAAGKVLYKPVADWIAHTAMRLQHRARVEMARQLNDLTLQDDARASLQARLRRELRVDALHVLAFRHNEACDAREAEYRAAVAAEIPVAKVYRDTAVSPDLQVAVEAHREAVQSLMLDSDESDERTDAGLARIKALADAMRAIPARSLADLRYRMLYTWSGIIGEMNETQARLDLTRLDEDVQALAGGELAAVTAAVDLDPIHAVIATARRLGAAHVTACHPDKPADEPDTPEIEERREDAHDDLWAHIDKVLLKTVPQTAEGCRALARFAIDFVREQGVPLLHAYDGSEPDPVCALIARSPLLSAAPSV